MVRLGIREEDKIRILGRGVRFEIRQGGNKLDTFWGLYSYYAMAG